MIPLRVVFCVRAAGKTAKTTEDINRKIEGIQSDSKGAVDAIASITPVINEVNNISSTIAAAVEETERDVGPLLSSLKTDPFV